MTGQPRSCSKGNMRSHSPIAILVAIGLAGACGGPSGSDEAATVSDVVPPSQPASVPVLAATAVDVTFYYLPG